MITQKQKDCLHPITVYTDTADGCLIVTCDTCGYKDICIPVEEDQKSGKI